MIWLSGLAAAGCNGPMRDNTDPRLLSTADASHYLQQALDSPRADTRRQAVNRLGQSRHVRERPVIDALALVARRDVSAGVRTAAVHALAQSGDDALLVNVTIELLTPVAEGGTPPAGLDAGVRAEAVTALVGCAQHGSLPETTLPRVQRVGMDLLHGDPSRHVRVAAAELLGHFPSKEVLYELVEALDERDFGVRYAAERALMALTGRTYQHDAAGWRQFVATAEDPFAERGKLAGELQPAPANWWADGWTAFRDTLAGYRPKEEPRR